MAQTAIRSVFKFYSFRLSRRQTTDHAAHTWLNRPLRRKTTGSYSTLTRRWACVCNDTKLVPYNLSRTMRSVWGAANLNASPLIPLLAQTSTKTLKYELYAFSVNFIRDDFPKPSHWWQTRLYFGSGSKVIANDPRQHLMVASRNVSTLASRFLHDKIPYLALSRTHCKAQLDTVVSFSKFSCVILYPT